MILVIGLGVVWQIPCHDDAMSAAEEHRTHSSAEPQAAAREGATTPSDSGVPSGRYRTIALEVTGMT